VIAASSGSSIHCAGAAVAAARLRRLDAERTAHAIAIALYRPPFGLWPGFMGPDTKLLTAAEPVAQGIRAAMLAASGFTGPLDVIESRRGFLTHFSYAPRPSMLDRLAEVWLTDTLAYKQHPGCAYLQAAVEGLLRLQDENGFVGCLAEREDELRDLATRVFVTHDRDQTAKTRSEDAHPPSPKRAGSDPARLGTAADDLPLPRGDPAAQRRGPRDRWPRARLERRADRRAAAGRQREVRRGPRGCGHAPGVAAARYPRCLVGRTSTSLIATCCGWLTT
jgi:2-methylcitrate dehydratase MmgE/PrpD-like protein